MRSREGEDSLYSFLSWDLGNKGGGKAVKSSLLLGVMNLRNKLLDKLLSLDQRLVQGRHTNGQGGGNIEAKEVGNIFHHRGHCFWHVLSAAAERTFKYKSVMNSMEMERARFAVLQKNVKYFYNDLNQEQDKPDQCALNGAIETEASNIGTSMLP